jgi:hypothetical protein
MLLYLANPSTALTRARMSDSYLGAIMTPKQGNLLPRDALFCVDNGCGPGRDGKPGNGYPGDGAYLTMLIKLRKEDLATGADRYDPLTSRCLFATAPDVVGNAEATIERSRYILPLIREYADLPAAFVAQNGMERVLAAMSAAETEEFWDDFDVLFLGGSKECVPCGFVRPAGVRDEDMPVCPRCSRPLGEWKLGPAAAAMVREAQARRKWIHMGRVNTRQRLRYATYIGCDSADGTGMTRAPDKNLAQMLAWLREIDTQLALFAS